MKSTIHHGDCIETMRNMDAGSVDLVFADPPFNIDYKYDGYDDNRSSEDYLDWSKKWISGVMRVFKPDGTFWLAIVDDYAAELKVMATRHFGFTLRSWVIWYYTFGVNCKQKFTRSHTHLLYFTNDSKLFTFNPDAIKMPSARQRIYDDKRAKSGGRLPDDTWLLLPENADVFTPDQDVWNFSRVCGTFKERAGFHGCQMPEALMDRIVLACSNEGDLVLEPFLGSGSTAEVCLMNHRRCLGFEIMPEYVNIAASRLGSFLRRTAAEQAQLTFPFGE